MKVFNSLDKFKKFLKEEKEYTKIEEDFNLSQYSDYNKLSTVKGKGCLTFDVPDLKRLFGIMKVEVGMATVEGFGRSKIKFNQNFSETPSTTVTTFGFHEIEVPWIAIQWRTYTIGWICIRVPIPRITTMKIRIPSLCFMMDVDKEGFEVLNILGRTTITYIAIGR